MACVEESDSNGLKSLGLHHRGRSLAVSGKGHKGKGVGLGVGIGWSKDKKKLKNWSGRIDREKRF